MTDTDYDAENKLTLDIITSSLYEEIGTILTSITRDLSTIPNEITNILQGRGEGCSELNNIMHSRSKSIGYEDLAEKSQQLFKLAEGIWLEKGYRYGGAILTYNEHKEIGSTVYNKFKEMPNTVTQIARKILGIEDSGELMTLEEIRRARILKGMSTIDDNGNVTGEIVHISDSYHFLTEERKKEVKELEKKIVSELSDVVKESIYRNAVDLTKYEELIIDLAKGRVSKPIAYAELEKLKINKAYFSKLQKIAEDARKISYSEGNRDDILTPMELSILRRPVDEKCKLNPYTPLGIQKGDLNVEDANKRRAEEGFFDLETDFFTGYTRPFSLSLELLDKGGQTERGPLVLTYDTKEAFDNRAIEYFKDKALNVPFSRPTDWYHKPRPNTPPIP